MIAGTPVSLGGKPTSPYGPPSVLPGYGSITYGSSPYGQDWYNLPGLYGSADMESKACGDSWNFPGVTQAYMLAGSPEVIQEAKRRLTELGYYAGTVDGLENESFREALRGFQANWNLANVAITGKCTAAESPQVVRQLAVDADYGCQTRLALFSQSAPRAPAAYMTPISGATEEGQPSGWGWLVSLAAVGVFAIYYLGGRSPARLGASVEEHAALAEQLANAVFKLRRLPRSSSCRQRIMDLVDALGLANQAIYETLHGKSKWYGMAKRARGDFQRMLKEDLGRCVVKVA